MIKTVWLNLPVKDLNKSKEFFRKLGFSFDTEHGNSEHSACFVVGEDKFNVLLFPEKTFKGFTQNEIADTGKGTEVLISIGAEAREEVDELARKAFEAGGRIFGEPGEKQGWMYGCGFADLDGHRWNVLYMDFGKMPHQ
jgi:predicted lactoylglutathione lyase